MEVIEMKNKSFFATLVFIVIFGIGIILAYSMNNVLIGIVAFIIALLVSLAISNLYVIKLYNHFALIL